MATNRFRFFGLPRRQEHDQVSNTSCTVCNTNHVTKKAISCCIVCLKNFCSRCLEFHNKLHQDHLGQILNVSGKWNFPRESSPCMTLTKTCADHKDQLVDMFCRKHNVVCCIVCLETKHRHCDDVKYIPHFADGFSKDPEVAEIKAELNNVKRSFNNTRISRQNDLTRIEQDRDRVLRKVQEFRRRINLYFDNLEESVFKEGDQMYKGCSEAIMLDIGDCDEAIERIDEAVEELGDQNTLDGPQLFVHVKENAENLNEWRKLCRKIKSHCATQTISFVIDETVEELVASIEKLGEFVIGLDEPVERREVESSKCPVVRAKDDTEKCKITGSCFLPDGDTLIADCNNDSLKRLDSTFQVIDCCKINEPFAVSYIPDTHEAAVTLGKGLDNVKIVSLEPKMIVVRSIKMGKRCTGICYYQGLLYVTQDTDKLSVYHYSTGTHKTTVSKDHKGKMIFYGGISHVAICPSGNRIWVADYNKGLVLLDKDLRLLRVAKDRDLDMVTGVCIDGDTVFACDGASRSVVQLNQDGEKLCTLVPRGGLPEAPWSVAYDEGRSRLIVTMENRDSVCVYQLI